MPALKIPRNQDLKMNILTDQQHEVQQTNKKVYTFTRKIKQKVQTIVTQTGENCSPAFEVKATHLGNHDFRVEADGVSMDVSLAVYYKDQTKHIHIWHGSHHHQFRQKIGRELSDDDEAQHKPGFDTASHPRGTVVAPMAGLVVKVLVKDGTKVEEGQPIIVLEAMKMEHVVKAPCTGCVHGLVVTAGQQVSDGSVLFSVKDP